MGGAALHALQEPWQFRRGMQSDEQVDVRGHHADFQESRALLSRDNGEVFAEIHGAHTVQRRNPVPGDPDEVDMQAMMHTRMLAELMPGNDANHRGMGRFHEFAAESRDSAGVDKATPATSDPNSSVVDRAAGIDHTTAPAPRPNVCRFSDSSRAVALATSSVATSSATSAP